MSIKFLPLVICLAMSLPAQALSLKDLAKEAAEKSGIDTNVINKDKTPTEKPTPQKYTTPTFNWKNPSNEEEVQLGREITGNLLGASAL
ncbi:MAG: hypothetical protein U1E13_04800, partial [Methylophilaceae bacterium]|nr:hypothetical protein [Methylophilaceae bacterium]